MFKKKGICAEGKACNGSYLLLFFNIVIIAVCGKSGSQKQICKQI